MTINFTLVVQILHFIIAYFLITKLLLKPAIAIIFQEKKNENDLKQLIQLKTLEINNKKAIKNSLWLKATERFKSMKPILEKQKSLLIYQTPNKIEITSDVINNLKNNLTNFVIREIMNAKK